MKSDGTTAVPIRILIVESDRPSRESLTELFRTLRQEVTAVTNSVAALILLEADRFDLMLVSCSSTALDGFRNANLLTEAQGLALVQFARASDSKLKIILIGAAEQEDFNTARGKGVIDRVMTRPFTILDLEKELAALFGR